MEWQGIWNDFWHLGVSFLLSLAVGWNREREEHNTGVRAFPIVCMASCAFVMMASPHADETSRSRVLQGLVAGVGFIGGGAILKDGMKIKGTATAASVLGAAAIGSAVGMDRPGIALSLTLLIFVALRALLPIKRQLDGDN